VRDAERGEIVADHRHHRRDCACANEGQPLRLRSVAQADAKFGRELAADAFQIVAGIKPLGDRPDRLAERLAVTQVGRTGEHVDLCARVVDVIFARDLAAGKGEQIGERVAEHRPARVADMHRAGRIGAYVLDVDRAAGFFAAAERSDLEDVSKHGVIDCGLQADVEEAGAGHFDRDDVDALAKPLSE